MEEVHIFVLLKIYPDVENSTTTCGHTTPETLEYPTACANFDTRRADYFPYIESLYQKPSEDSTTPIIRY